MTEVQVLRSIGRASLTDRLVIRRRKLKRPGEVDVAHRFLAPWSFLRTPNPAVRKRLAGDPHGRSGAGPWDGRKTGSAATECAFVAAGLLQVARFETPNIWDVAGGIALARASGASVYWKDGSTWSVFEGFGDSLAEMVRWRRPLILGSSVDATLMMDMQGE